MTTPTFEAFREAMLAEGFEEVIERTWAPNAVVPTHTHPFRAKALVVQGEMWLGVEGTTRHLKPGEGFELAAGLVHDERYGPEGATYWVARK